MRPTAALRQFVIVASLLVARAAAPLPPSWAVYPGANAVPHCPSTCTSPPPFRCLGLFPGATPDACFAACVADGSCDQATWAADDGRCFTRTDGAWALVPGATAAACNNATVRGCAAAPPADGAIVNAALADAPAGVPLHALAPGVTLDGWNASGFPRWGAASFLALDLGAPKLRALAAAVAPAILRLGGSPADSIRFDADGTCVAGTGGDGPAPGGYFCSQVKPYVYGCLTPARWEALLDFANATGLRIVFGLNACEGRMSSSTPMDFANVRALLRATAASPNRHVVVGFELGNEIVGTTVTAAAWGADARTLRGLVDDAFGAGAPFLAGPDGASPTHARDALGSASGAVAVATYHHYPGCLPTRFFALDPVCLGIVEAWGVLFSAVGRPAGAATWAGETAEHGGGGVANLTDSWSSSLYYAWQLAALGATGVELSARQALVGGDYGLLAHDGTFAPMPDFYILWLFRALVGGGARSYNVTVDAPVAASGVRVFALDAAAGAGAARVVVIVSLNTLGASARVRLAGADARAARREWHVRGTPGVARARVTCNGVALSAGDAGELPDARALGVAGVSGSDVLVDGASVVFVALQA